MSNPLARHGGLSYLEIPAADPARSARFYEQVVGWQVDRRSEDDYRFAAPDGLLIGRWLSGRKTDAAAGFVPFVYVESVAEAVARAQSNGGELLEPAVQEGDTTIARLRDP